MDDRILSHKNVFIILCNKIQYEKMDINLKNE